MLLENMKTFRLKNKLLEDKLFSEKIFQNEDGPLLHPFYESYSNFLTQLCSKNLEKIDIFFDSFDVSLDIHSVLCWLNKKHRNLFLQLIFSRKKEFCFYQLPLQSSLSFKFLKLASLSQVKYPFYNEIDSYFVEEYIKSIENVKIDKVVSKTERINKSHIFYLSGKKFYQLGNIQKTLYYLQKSSLLCYPRATLEIALIFLKDFKNLQTSTKYLQDPSLQDDQDSQYILGSIFSLKNSSSYNFEKAEFLLKKAVRKGNVEAMISLASLHFETEKKNFKKIIKYLTMASEIGNQKADLFLSHIFLSETSQKNTENAKIYLERASLKGNVEAMNMMVSIYFEEEYEKKSFDKTIHLLKLLSEKEDPNADMFLSRILLYQNDIKNAKIYLERASLKGNVEAMNMMASIYFEEEYEKKSFDKTMRLLKLLSEKEDPNADVFLSRILLYQNDIKNAKIYLERASLKGNVEAMNMMVSIYFEEEYEKKSFDKTIHLLKLLSEKEDPNADMFLSRILLYQNDIENAKIYLERASLKGNVEAMNMMASIYFEEEYEKKSFDKTIHLLKLLSEKEDPNADMFLSRILLYQNDIENAKIYFERASLKGNVEAMNMMVSIYFEEEYEKKSFDKTIQLLKLLSEKEDPNADLFLSHIFLSEIPQKNFEKGKFHLERACLKDNANAKKLLESISYLEKYESSKSETSFQQNVDFEELPFSFAFDTENNFLSTKITIFVKDIFDQNLALKVEQNEIVSNVENFLKRKLFFKENQLLVLF